jgi:beta-N-acetylhexosaminidase
VHAVIFGCQGPVLTDTEKRFFESVDPVGFILFARNCETPEQVGRLVADLRQSVGRHAPVLIDQEGGRVQRLKPPHWRQAPAGRVFGDLHARDPEAAKEAATVNSRLIARELMALDIDVDCLPVLDVPVDNADNVIGDRAYGTDPDLVAELGRAAADGLMAEGVDPVIKHVPGHGRAMVDSHYALPVVDIPEAELQATDFAPFRALNDLPWGMTAHVVYTRIDPDSPATLSKKVVDRVIRGHIGFSGLLMTDDLSMKALGGGLAERASAALAAGCDIVLHCNGDMDEMIPVSEGAAAVTDRVLDRLQARADKKAAVVEPDDTGALLDRLNTLLEDKGAGR